jgi:hypothetical protein
MKIKALIIVLIICLFTLFSGINAPFALALTPIKLSEISYHDCPAEYGEGFVTSDGSGQEAKCYLITGKAENNSGKLIVDADVFGRIYDANGEPALQNRTRLGTIMEVPPGMSDFEIRISVPANQPTPLQLKQFKASGFTSQVRPFYYDQD